jgi:hypothetical protein
MLMFRIIVLYNLELLRYALLFSFWHDDGIDQPLGVLGVGRWAKSHLGLRMI